MKLRTRKLFGMFAMVAWLVVYALVVMAMAGRWIVGSGIFPELAFFILAGAAWLPVAMVIIRWMSRPDEV
jgi:Protein of unknown function (DUF2842)